MMGKEPDIKADTKAPKTEVYPLSHEAPLIGEKGSLSALCSGLDRVL